jgi:uncharacterized delta-60 repeat protein
MKVFMASFSMNRRIGRGFILFTVSALSAYAQSPYWDADPAFSPVLESTTSVGAGVVAAPNGKLMVASSYSVNGVVRKNMARLNADGSVDLSFTPPDADALEWLANYPDGRMLVARSLAGFEDVVRLLTDGSIDPSFSSPLPAATSSNRHILANILPDLRIVISGEYLAFGQESGIALLNANGTISALFHSPFNGTSLSDTTGLTVYPLPDGRFFITGTFLQLGVGKLRKLARLNADGSIDDTFNANAVLTPVGSDYVSAVFPQPDGTVLLSIGSGSLIRLNTDGSADPTFGAQTVGTPGRFGPADNSGRILYSTRFTTNTGDKTEIHRLNPDGSADSAFILEGSYQPVAAPDGTYYVANSVTDERATHRFVVSHFFSNGQLDPNFSPRFSGFAVPSAFVRQPDGKFVLAGTFDYLNGVALPRSNNLVRLDATGAVDATFSAALSTGESISTLRLQPNGKLIALGTTLSGDIVHTSVARFNLDGSRDSNFRLPAQVVRIGLDTDGFIYGACSDDTGLLILNRYTPDGDLDPSFATAAVGNGPFAIMPDGTVVKTSSFSVFGLSRTTLVRLRHDGTTDPAFTIDYTRLPANLAAVAGLPDGRVMTMGTLGSVSPNAYRFVGFDRNGAVDFTFIGPQIIGSLPVFDLAATRALGGVLLDALRNGSAASDAQVSVDVSLLSSGGSVELSNDGHLAAVIGPRITGPAFATYLRTAAAQPSFDARPWIRSSVPDPTNPPVVILQGGSLTLSVSAGGLFPLSYVWKKNGVAIPGATDATLQIKSATGDDAGSYILEVSNPYGQATSKALQVAVNTTVSPLVLSASPASKSTAVGGSISLTSTATGNPVPVVQWYFNGTALSPAPIGTSYSFGSTSATVSSILSLSNLQPVNAGIYVAEITGGGATITPTPAIVGLTTIEKVTGVGRVADHDIHHPNGNIFDQILLTGAAAAITAEPGKITRISYIDLSDDIVQVEFSGAGTLSLVMDPVSVSGPAMPFYYNQPDVSYMKGHAGIVIAGANETTNVSVFSVGRATAFDPTGAFNIIQPVSTTNNPVNNGSPLFQGHGTTAYDGIADIAFVAILSSNGKFGGVRTANANYFAAKGVTGIYAPGVQFTGPVFVGDLNAVDAARPMFILGSALGETRITGGNLVQMNSQPIAVSGVTRLQFTAGADSQGRSLAAKACAGRLEEDGVDVTAKIVVNPAP